MDPRLKPLLELLVDQYSTLWQSINKYTTSKPDDHPEFDPSLIEESHLAPLCEDIIDFISVECPSAITDRDGDGNLEIDAYLLCALLPDLERAGLISSIEQPLPLTAYFDDTRSIKYARDRLGWIPDGMREFTANHDFSQASDYFADHAAGGIMRSARMLAFPLQQHLTASAMHAGINVAEHVMLEDEWGFSVNGDGRLRFDCGVFTQLFHNDLSKIPGLPFHYVVMYNGELPAEFSTNITTNTINRRFEPAPTPKPTPGPGPSPSGEGGHMIGVAKFSDGYLVQDNNSVRFVQTDDIWEWIRNEYGEKFENFGRRTSYQDEGNTVAF